ncbi:MAG: hypothetical protein IH872_07610 [Chloroflexi bacterium]|nr:hypothetical protein [Chloroflexota bacterium]
MQHLDLLGGQVAFQQAKAGVVGAGVELDCDGLIAQRAGIVVAGVSPDQQRLVGD